MSGGFEHSIRVPRLYKTVANIVKTVREDGASLKQLVYLKKHPNIKALYALALTSLQHGSQLDQLIRSTKILVNEPRLDPWLARVLITELLWGKKQLNSECKPVKTVVSYEKLLREELLNNVQDFSQTNGNNRKKVEKPRYVRVNTLAMSVREAIASFEEEGWRPLYRSKNYNEFIEAVSNLSGQAFIQDIHVPELLIFPPKTQFYNHPAYTSGAIILQDKASCLPAYLLNAHPGSTVLDMCASPGMKTTHLAAMLENKGKIYAVEIDQRRYQTLCEIISSTNSYCVETVNADVMTLNANKCPGVEYILVDPSCSGSGMLDRPELEISSNEKCAPGRLRNLQSFQIIILRHALLNFPQVKRIVYSTCSIYPEENEQVVDDVLSQVGDSYKLVPAKSLMKNNWLNYSSKEFACKENCLYARPETDLSNGFFVAVFERNFDVPLPDIKRKQKEKNQMVESNGNENVNVDEEKPELLSNGKKNKKRKKVVEEINAENLTIENEEQVIDDLEGEAAEKVKRDRRKDSEAEETKTDNDYCEIMITAKRKKSKRKKEFNDAAETVQDTEIITKQKKKKKKKKCKKSRAEYEDPVDSVDILKDEELEFSGEKKRAKKSKKHLETLEIAEELEKRSSVKDSNSQFDENMDETVSKKRKKKKIKSGE